MRDYALLAKSFRHCAEKRECASCPMYVKERKCPDFEVRKLAADAIEELQSELVTIRHQLPQWISVEERLPETGKVVLLYINCEKSRPHTGFLTVDGGFMHDVIGDMSRSKWKVTHWMPLPPPPARSSQATPADINTADSAPPEEVI